MMEYESNPAYALIGAYRTQGTPTTLFDSDIQHSHTVVVKIEHAERARDLHRDWIHGRKQIIEIQMSEAQWASFVSSMNSSGVPCTLLWTEQDGQIPRLEYAPRLEQSMNETRKAADEMMESVLAAFNTYKEHKTVGNLRSLEAAIANAGSNVEFAAKSLSAHAENVVTKARADIEAMVSEYAAHHQLESVPTLALPVGEES